MAPGLDDASAVEDGDAIGALVLFVVPTSWRRFEFALDWPTANRIPWSILVLFGGGLSMAHAMSETGLAAYVGGAVSELTTLPDWAVFGAVAFLFLFLTEVTSNVATATMAMLIMNQNGDDSDGGANEYDDGDVRR